MRTDRCLQHRQQSPMMSPEVHSAACTRVVTASLLAGLCCVALSACGGSGTNRPAMQPAQPLEYTAFGNPEPVTIIGYDGDAMEPFVSRDGVYLFFNDDGADKNIFYAAFIDATSVQYQGPIASINTSAVDGTPSMDADGRFFYISTASYTPPTAYDTLYSGKVERQFGNRLGRPRWPGEDGAGRGQF